MRTCLLSLIFHPISIFSPIFSYHCIVPRVWCWDKWIFSDLDPYFNSECSVCDVKNDGSQKKCGTVSFSIIPINYCLKICFKLNVF